MRRLRHLVAAVAMLLLTITGLAVTAHAFTIENGCQDEIAALRAQTEATTFLGQNADETKANLLAKLDAASAKLAEGKFTDASQKLVDFRTTVEALAAAAKPKISAEDAATLIALANDAIACIESLQAATTTTTTAA